MDSRTKSNNHTAKYRIEPSVAAIPVGATASWKTRRCHTTTYSALRSVTGFTQRRTSRYSYRASPSKSFQDAGRNWRVTAVATECFFEKPRQLSKKHPELFEELKAYYGLDPLEWV
jgi:hypothetical protein